MNQLRRQIIQILVDVGTGKLEGFRIYADSRWPWGPPITFDRIELSLNHDHSLQTTSVVVETTTTEIVVYCEQIVANRRVRHDIGVSDAFMLEAEFKSIVEQSIDAAVELQKDKA